MRNKVLILDSEIFDEQSVLEKMKYRTNDPLTTLHKVEDIESFSQEIIYHAPWKIVIVNFLSPEFWDTKPSDLEKFVEDTRKHQKDHFEFIAVTGYKKQISLLARLGLIVTQKQYNGIHSDETNIRETKKIEKEDIVSIVSDYYSISKDEIIGRIRKETVIKARNMAMYLVRLLTKDSLKEIGIFFSGRDYSTVKKQNITAKKEIDSDKLYKGDFLILKEKIRILQNTILF